MEFRDIEIFLALAEELHFGRTAERLHVTPSRVSHVIKKAERRIGGPLFERTSRTVSLTPLGERLRDGLQPAHVQIQQAVDRAVAEARGITGTLTIGYTTPWCADLALQAAEVFRDRYADCTVRIQEIQFHDPYGPLRRGELDLQIAEVPAPVPGVTDGPVLFREPRALMVPADHPLAARDTVSLEDLAEAPMIKPRGEVPKILMDLHLPAHTPMGSPVPAGPTFSFWAEVPALVAAGLGVSVVACRAARFHSRPGIAFVPFQDGPTLDYGVLWPATGQTPSALAYVDLLVDLAYKPGDD
ncbi:LysR family transcriptional regulator [Actinomadura barringtoniae]|uniref:LysR family transcriptional regulator n=1 Tax=Actinomadura barringtoniae TaxID=1427535 RepID=A0A939TFA6_9ACTN|nr:LysR family transcriptional regulator [Actinomadura barringtoniae]MBO2454165.1 LysR family transcriptional regulator [Actinomadura barringtoniae]